MKKILVFLLMLSLTGYIFISCSDKESKAPSSSMDSSVSSAPTSSDESSDSGSQRMDDDFAMMLYAVTKPFNQSGSPEFGAGIAISDSTIIYTGIAGLLEDGIKKEYNDGKNYYNYWTKAEVQTRAQKIFGPGIALSGNYKSVGIEPYFYGAANDWFCAWPSGGGMMLSYAVESCVKEQDGRFVLTLLDCYDPYFIAAHGEEIQYSYDVIPYSMCKEFAAYMQKGIYTFREENGNYYLESFRYENYKGVAHPIS